MTPMYDVPDHLLIPVTADGKGPADETDAHHMECWCRMGQQCPVQPPAPLDRGGSFDARL